MKNLLLALLSILLLTACVTNQDSSNLALDNGNKWHVNTEMKPHLEQENLILEDYISQGRTDHLALAEALKAQNGTLIKSCTMKGESHDQLHKWLHPHMMLIDELAKADDAEEAKIVVTQLTESFVVYARFFE
ncbi:MAG: hypothetical protein AB8F78_14280 [Saprospiraceae bacterium]